MSARTLLEGWTVAMLLAVLWCELRPWRERRRVRRAEDLRHRGFDYAAGELLRGVSDEEIESRISTHDYSEFDRGVLEALRTWSKLTCNAPTS